MSKIRIDTLDLENIRFHLVDLRNTLKDNTPDSHKVAITEVNHIIEFVDKFNPTKRR